MPGKRLDVPELRRQLDFHLGRVRKLQRQIREARPKRRDKTLSGRILKNAEGATTVEIAVVCATTTAYVRKILTSHGWTGEKRLLPHPSKAERRWQMVWQPPKDEQ